MRKLIFLLTFSALLLAACSGGPSPAVTAVERYYQALVEKNDEQLTQSTCADWEEQALLEFDSFQGVEIELDNAFSCAETGKEGDATLVTCTGKLIASYGNEKMDFPLGDRVHKVQNEGGDWRVCGY